MDTLEDPPVSQQPTGAHFQYEGECRKEGVKFPVSWEVLPDGRVQNVRPPELERQLYGACYVAHVNHSNLVEHGATMAVPSDVIAQSRTAISHLDDAASL